MMRSEIVSWWLPEMSRQRGTVALVMRPIHWSLRELATRGCETSTRGMPQRATAPVSKKLSSAPESSKAEVFLLPPLQSRVIGRQVQLRVEESRGITPTSAPQSTSGHDLLPGISRQNVQPLHSTNKPAPELISHIPPSIAWIGPPSWLLPLVQSLSSK